MNADESVSSGRRLIHLVGDGDEPLHCFDFSAFIGVYRRLIAFSRMNRACEILRSTGGDSKKEALLARRVGSA
jgi:hypothetical protein